jgi:hypothetical protein
MQAICTGYNTLHLIPQGGHGEDLSGGYYEAGGSYLKVGLPEAFPMTELAWTILLYGSALSRVGLLDEALSALRWGTDYLVRTHTLPSCAHGSPSMQQQLSHAVSCISLSGRSVIFRSTAIMQAQTPSWL